MFWLNSQAKKCLKYLYISLTLSFLTLNSYATRLPFVWYVSGEVGTNISSNNEEIGNAAYGLIQTDTTPGISFMFNSYLEVSHQGAEHTYLAIPIGIMQKIVTTRMHYDLENIETSPVAPFDPLKADYYTYDYNLIIDLLYINTGIIWGLNIKDITTIPLWIKFGFLAQILIGGNVIEEGTTYQYKAPVWRYFDKVNYALYTAVSYQLMKVRNFDIMPTIGLIFDTTLINKFKYLLNVNINTYFLSLSIRFRL